jgi:CheY-like chemotaxis protein
MTLLVVDDDATYRLLLGNILRTEGHETLLAEDGEEALEKLEEIKVDMIISDVYMPVMDGFKLHKAVRSDPRWEKLPFLFVSAYTDQYTLEAVRNPRYDGFLQKGKPTADLLAWINHMNLPEEERASKIPGLSTSGPEQRKDYRGRRLS